jgi:hypothetical protein
VTRRAGDPDWLDVWSWMILGGALVLLIFNVIRFWREVP